MIGSEENPVIRPSVTAGANSGVIANVQYNGGGHYAFDIDVNGKNHPYGGTGGYDGSVVEEIAERPEVSGSHVPLLNFKVIEMEGLNGRTLQPLPAPPTSYQYDMTGFATTRWIGAGAFTVSQNNCNG
jgi:hypothetical protein